MWIEVVGLMYYDAHHLHNLLLGPRASPGMISHHYAVEISWSLDTVMADTMSSRCNYVGCDQRAPALVIIITCPYYSYLGFS